MNFEILAQNIRRLRAARGISQNALAGAAGISLPSVKLMESGKSSPRMNTLQAVAKSLDVKLQDLFAPVRELKTVRFRSGKRMKNRENILADVARWLDDFNFLEEILNEKLPFKLKEVRRSCSPKNIPGAAALCRQKLGLRDDEPVRDVCGLLESAGVKVFTPSMASENFFGLSVGEDDGGPAVVVNSWERITTERKIFSAAHELGHLMLHKGAFDVARQEEDEREEQQANIFAGHFLMPDDAFRSEWNDTAGLHWIDRVFKVKRIFRVSHKTVLARLIEHGKADGSIWMRFNMAYQNRFGRKLPFKEEPESIESAEPAALQKWDFYEDRYSRLAREAMEKDEISLSRGAEILRISIDEMQELLQNWEAVL